MKIEQNNAQNEGLKQKINKLQTDNVNLNQEVSQAQESLRLSANQQAKLNRELNEYKTQMAANNQ